MKTFKISIPNDRGKKYDYLKFSAGEIDIKIRPDQFDALRKAPIIEITANLLDGEVMELALMVSALAGVCRRTGRTASSYIVNLNLPYLPYGRADREFVEGGSQGLRTFGTLINELGFDSVFTFDVHSPEAFNYINNLINLSPVEHYPEIADVIKAIGTKDLALVLPDKGAVSRYSTLDVLGYPILLGGKTRDAATGALNGFTAPEDMEGYSKFLIVDDICDGGGTFVGLAKAMREKAKSYPEIYLYTSHGIYSKGIDELTTYFDGIFASDFSPFPLPEVK